MGDLWGPQWAQTRKRLMEYIKIKGPKTRGPGLGDSNPGFTGEGMEDLRPLRSDESDKQQL